MSVARAVSSITWGILPRNRVLNRSQKVDHHFFVPKYSANDFVFILFGQWTYVSGVLHVEKTQIKFFTHHSTAFYKSNFSLVFDARTKLAINWIFDEAFPCLLLLLLLLLLLWPWAPSGAPICHHSFLVLSHVVFVTTSSSKEYNPIHFRCHLDNFVNL